MLGTEQKRAAAVTMLGKTVERCADQVRLPWLLNPGKCQKLWLTSSMHSR